MRIWITAPRVFWYDSLPLPGYDESWLHQCVIVLPLTHKARPALPPPHPPPKGWGFTASGWFSLFTPAREGFSNINHERWPLSLASVSLDRLLQLQLLQCFFRARTAHPWSQNNPKQMMQYKSSTISTWDRRLVVPWILVLDLLAYKEVWLWTNNHSNLFFFFFMSSSRQIILKQLSGTFVLNVRKH